MAFSKYLPPQFSIPLKINQSAARGASQWVQGNNPAADQLWGQVKNVATAPGQWSGALPERTPEQSGVRSGQDPAGLLAQVQQAQANQDLEAKLQAQIQAQNPQFTPQSVEELRGQNIGVYNQAVRDKYNGQIAAAQSQIAMEQAQGDRNVQDVTGYYNQARDAIKQSQASAASNAAALTQGLGAAKANLAGVPLTKAGQQSVGRNAELAGAYGSALGKADTTYLAGSAANASGLGAYAAEQARNRADLAVAQQQAKLAELQAGKGQDLSTARLQAQKDAQVTAMQQAQLGSDLATAQLTRDFAKNDQFNTMKDEYLAKLQATQRPDIVGQQLIAQTENDPFLRLQAHNLLKMYADKKTRTKLYNSPSITTVTDTSSTDK